MSNLQTINYLLLPSQGKNSTSSETSLNHYTYLSTKHFSSCTKEWYKIQQLLWNNQRMTNVLYWLVVRFRWHIKFHVTNVRPILIALFSILTVIGLHFVTDTSYYSTQLNQSNVDLIMFKYMSKHACINEIFHLGNVSTVVHQ